MNSICVWDKNVNIVHKTFDEELMKMEKGQMFCKGSIFLWFKNMPFVGHMKLC